MLVGILLCTISSLLVRLLFDQRHITKLEDAVDKLELLNKQALADAEWKSSNYEFAIHQSEAARDNAYRCLNFVLEYDPNKGEPIRVY